MAIINYLKKEIHIKIVYCGPGLSGKTTNLQWLNQNLRDGKVGKLISLATKTDRTLFFDLLAVSRGKVRGFDTRIQLFTTPGQVFYNATRKLVLKGVDGIVFVADSQEAMRAANRESLENLKENLSEYGREMTEIPMVLQYNKRDLRDVTPLDELQGELNELDAPYLEAAAVSGKGVRETFEAITQLTLENLRELQDQKTTQVTPGSVANAAFDEETPRQAPSPRPAATAEAALELKKAMPARVRKDGTLEIPVVLHSAKYDEDFSMLLEIRLTPAIHKP